MLHPYPYSITQMMEDITSSTIFLIPLQFSEKSNSNLRWDLTPQTFMEIMEIFKGILTDVEYFENMIFFFHISVALL